MRKKAPTYKLLSCSKAFKIQQVCHYRDAKKNQQTCLLRDTGVDSNSRNNLLA